jgi:uncharacterized Zn finger protein
MSRWGYYAPQPTIEELRQDSERKLAKLRKKNPDISPVVIDGSKLSTTWWGMAWNKNLERYADYENRIGRGKKYVKGGTVLDLQIGDGIITAVVNGSRIYEVTIEIEKLSKTKWERISKKCSHSIANLSELAEGKFPQELAQMFTEKGEGLFPSPKEIHMDCSCPDRADMCKHIAAALYGVGRRLDDDPLLFFKLRGIDADELIRKSVDEKMRNLLKNAGKQSKRQIDEGDIERIFGI